MGRFDDLARKRLTAWRAARPEITLTALGQAAGHNQPWASRYFNNEFDTTLDALGAMAALFEQPLSALFEEKTDPREVS